jgi:serine/threonine protein kinase
MIETGKVLQNRYRVQKQIGQGGMGAVYVATDERFGSVVAIKETLILEDNYRKAIEREARLLNSLRHSALPRVSDHFTDENGQYLVMEYIAGDDLYEMMERSGNPFLVADVLNWADQLLDALDFLHNQEIPVIHRDIKPQNLKLTPRGQIILLDFGLAKGNPTDAAHQTAAKSIFGYSRNYASLEQIQGTGTDPRSDLYSLSATLYHLLTGVPPEDALTRAMHVLSDKEDTLKPANSINPEIPAGVAAVLHSAMALNSNHRPASAKEMRRMLRENENYADLLASGKFSKPVFAGGKNTQTDVSNRPTQILPTGDKNQTDIKTKILPEIHSQETAIKAAPVSEGGKARKTNLFSAENTYSGESKRRPVLAAAAVGLLLVGTGASAVYWLKPEVFGSAPNESKAVELKVTAPNFTEGNINPATAAAVNTSSDTTNSVTSESVSTENPKTETKNTGAGSGSSKAETASKTVAKNNRAATSGSGKKKNAESEKVEGETVYIGNMKITEDMIEMPKIYIDENGVKHKLPIRVPLSPEQIERLKEAEKLRMMKLKRKQPIPPPVPVPSPKT